MMMDIFYHAFFSFIGGVFGGFVVIVLMNFLDVVRRWRFDLLVKRQRAKELRNQHAAMESCSAKEER